MREAVKLTILFGGLAIGGLFGFWLSDINTAGKAKVATASVDCSAIADDNLSDPQKLSVLLRLVRQHMIDTDPELAK